MKNIILGKKTHHHQIKEETSKAEKLDNKVRVEDIQKREVFAKHFKNDDGTYTMEISPQPIHYYDESTKQYEDIDNILEDDNATLKLTRNSFKLEFNKDLDENQVLRMNKGKTSISLKYFGKKEANNVHSLRKSRAKARNNDRFVNSLVYEEIAQNIDLEYIVSHNTIKENIIIKQKQETYEFSFELSIGDYKVQLSSDEKNIELVDSKGQVQFIIPSPVMIDETGDVSEDVSYELEEIGNGVMALVVKADAGWINADERVLPVRIDPQFISVDLEASGLNHYGIMNNQIVPVLPLYAKNMPVTNIVSYAINIDKEKIFDCNITMAKLNVMVAGSAGVEMIVSEYDDPNAGEVPFETLTFVPANCRQICTFTIKKMEPGERSISIVDYLIERLKHSKKSLKIIFRLNGQASSAVTVTLLSITIEYTAKTILPNHYLTLGKRTMVETISTFELGMEEMQEIKDGVLTSTIDIINQKVYQQYLFENELLIRTSYQTAPNTYEWTEWERLSSEFTIEDTRDKNYDPSYYMEKGTSVVTEFKHSNALGNGAMGVGPYGILTTYVPWRTDSGGVPMQEYRSKGTSLMRMAHKENDVYTWTEWEYMNGDISIIDTRKNDFSPAYYIKKGSSIITEFKQSSYLGNNNMGVGAFGILTTYVPWQDGTGGLPSQEYRSNGVLLTRQSYKTNDEYQWGNWLKSGIKIKCSNNTLYITDDGSDPQEV